MCFLVGTIIQGLIALNVPEYSWHNWHGTLLSIAVVIFSILFNTALASRLPTIEGGALVLHISGFFTIILPLWIMGPRARADVVLLEFVNNGGWPTVGLSAMIGLLAPMAVLVGYDCSVHMCKFAVSLMTRILTCHIAEETMDASIALPRAIMGSVLINASLAFVMCVTLAFRLGDIDSVLSTTTGCPFIQVFYNATNSYAGTNVMLAISSSC